jgi:CRISPR-associated protein Cmr4
MQSKGPMQLEDLLLGIKLITPLHIGSGEMSFEVDRPIIRDALGIPYIPASSLKGALRRYAKAIFNNNNDVKVLFGSETNDENKNPSMIDILDAVPIFFLARELTNGYCYVTTEYLLRRALDYYRAVTNSQINKDDLRILNSLNESFDAVILKENQLFIDKNDRELIINEVQVSVNPNKVDSNEKDPVYSLLNEISKNFEIPDLLSRLVIIKDFALAKEVIDRSMIVYNRNRLEDFQKLVKPGALWSEEYIPYNTVFLSAMFFGRMKEPNEDEEVKIKEFLKRFPLELFLGGLESIGKGFSYLDFLFKGGVKQ